MTAGHAVLDVTDANFQTLVIDGSQTRPVVVDFWAEWCGPCRILGPVIERVAERYAGDVDVVKLNVDNAPEISRRYRVQGIPAVKAFRDGRVVNEFTGALPEPQVRAFFQSLAPSPSARAAQEAERLLATGDVAGAEQRFRAILAEKPDDPHAVVGLAGILARRGERQDAELLLKRVPTDRRAKVLRHRIFLEGYASRHAGEDLEGEARANPRDPRARYRWGVMLAANERYKEALDELLESVRLDRNWEDGAARKSMLAVFEILGMDSPVTRDYQRKLENVLF